jgi:Flp pilus assembly protein TadD
MARLSLAAPIILGLGLTGCAAAPDGQSLLTMSDGTEQTGSLSAMGTGVPKDVAAAREYWATAYAKNPHDEQAVISFAHALKADGAKDKALSVLQQAAIYNPDSRIIAGEEGRVALDMGQSDLASKLLSRANDPAHPDWRILNALGALEAQRNNRAGALGYFEKANQLAPADPAVLNNLALAYALGGDPAKAEALLRKAAAAGGDVARIRQNLSLVLGVEGKYEEAQQLAAADLGDDKAKANRSYLETMVAATPLTLGKRGKAGTVGPWQTALEHPQTPTGGKPVDDGNTAWLVDVASAQPAPVPANNAPMRARVAAQ